MSPCGTFFAIDASDVDQVVEIVPSPSRTCLSAITGLSRSVQLLTELLPSRTEFRGEGQPNWVRARRVRGILLFFDQSIGKHGFHFGKLRVIYNYCGRSARVIRTWGGA